MKKRGETGGVSTLDLWLSKKSTIDVPVNHVTTCTSHSGVKKSRSGQKKTSKIFFKRETVCKKKLNLEFQNFSLCFAMQCAVVKNLFFDLLISVFHQRIVRPEHF